MKLKVLLCSPYFEGVPTAACGIVNWTRNLYDYLKQQNTDIDVELLPFDRSVDLGEDSTFIERLNSGIKDYISLIKKTKKKLKKNHYDLIQISTSASLGLIKDYFILKAAHKRSIKIILHLHFGRIPELAEQNNIEWRMLNKVIKMATAAIVMDAKSYKTLKEHGIDNVYYLPNPLSIAIINKINGEKGQIQRVPRRLLFVGHVVRGKGIYELIEACTAFDNIELRIIGKAHPNTKNKLCDISKKKDNGGWLNLMGEIPHEEVIKEMLACDIYILPTYTEGFPNVILESMASACPIIASGVGAIPEMLDVDGDPCGLVIRPKNVDDIKTAIRKLIDDNKYKASLGEKAQKRVNEHYNVSSVWNQLSSIWTEINEKQ